jgi:putative copper export protein/methionine-rich copper-binding protein CopC
MSRLLRLFLPVFLVMLIFGIRPMLAHGYIVRAIPENRATLTRPPARLQYWFSEALEPEFSSLTLRNQSGTVLAQGGIDPDNDALMTLQVPPNLPDGAYLVDMRLAFASDGHVVAETRVFFVGEEVGGVAGSQSGYEVNTLEVAWRTLLYASLTLLLGAAVLYVHVLLPAWGSGQYPAGGLPPRVLIRLNLLFGTALTLALVGNLVAIAQQSMVFFNTGLSEVLAQGLWQVVRIGSRFGDVWTARMILLALAGALFGLSIYWRKEQPATVRAFWNANVWVAALMVSTFSVTSHAAGSLRMPWVAVAVDWAHVLAVGAWAGGLVALALVLPTALQPYSGDARRLAMLAVLRKFSRLVVSALVVVITTGIYSALNWIYQPSDATQTGWGMSLLVKLALVGGVLLVGSLHFVASNPERFNQWSARLQRTVNLAHTLRLEAFLALIVLVAAASLSASAVPEPTFVTASVSAPNATQTVDDLTVHATLSPAGPGVNTLDVVIGRDRQPVGDVPVRVQIVNPARDWRSEWQNVSPAGNGLYVTTIAGIGGEGRWLTLLDIGDAQRAAFAWEITQEAAVPTSINPGPLNVLALLGVLLALAWAAYPTAYRFYRWLDWTPVSVAIAASALITATVLIVGAVLLVSQSEINYEATLNPSPQVINPVLPDAGSLTQGGELYTVFCPGWAGDDLDALIERLPRTRDEELFFATRDGWRDLPPCAGNLTDEQRWHIVNFIRTLEA